jgi:hypothetical protein
MAGLLSPERAAVKPRIPAKRTQWKRLQSLLHISCPGALIEIQQHNKQIFCMMPLMNEHIRSEMR